MRRGDPWHRRIGGVHHLFEGCRHVCSSRLFNLRDERDMGMSDGRRHIMEEINSFENVSVFTFVSSSQSIKFSLVVLASL